MAQTLFDAFTGNISVENQAALVVQSLLDAQNVAETAQQVEEEDLFQCGKCKKQFTTLQSFIGHKQERCSPPAPLRPLPQQPASVPSNTASFQPAVQQQQQHHNNRQLSVAPLTPVAQSPLTQLSSGMVQLSDDIMAFTSIDPSLQTHTIQMTFPTVQQGGTVQGNPFLSQAIAPRASNANSVTIYSPVQSASFSSNGSAFTSTVPSNQIQVQSQPVTLVPAASIEKSAQPKPSPTKAGRKSAQSMNQQFITVSELSTPQKGKKGKVVTDAENASKRKMRCQYCSKTFNKNFDLQQHLRCHTGEKPFQCIVCGRAFAQKSNVKKHMTTHKVWPAGNDSTLPKPFNPPVVVVEDVVAGITQCNSTMTEETQEAEHNPQPIRELNIGSSTDGNGQQKLVVDNSYLCQYCPEKFKSYFQLKSHMITHKSEQVYKCVLKTCGLTFKNLDAYLEHMKTHEEGMTYRCHLCNKKFPSLYDLGVHQYTHSLYPSQSRACGPRYYQCTLCMNKYASPEALDHHLSTASHHHECPTCLKVFTCERYLRRHLITHGTFGQYQCSVCLRRFKAESYLKMHVLIHTGVKPFKCEQCNAAFNRKDKLKRHMLIHDAIKKFKCPFRSLTGCEMEFNRPDKLKAHIISHSGIKPYKCRECGKAFSRKSSLGEHESCHRAEFKFRCEKCGKGFFRPKLFHGHRCNPLVDKDGALIVPPTRIRSKRKVGRPRKRMITVTPDTIKSVSSVLTRRRARSRRDAAQAAVAESKEKVNSEGASKDESVKKPLKTEMEPQRAQNQVIPTESPAPANNTELISVPDSNRVTSRENYTPQDESLQAGPGQTNSDPVTNAHAEVDYHQAVTSAGYTTHTVPVHSYTLSSQHNSVQHHQHNLRSSEVADIVTLSAAEAISHDHNMAAAHSGLSMSEMPHVEIVQLSAAEVMPKTSQQSEMEIELSNSAGDGPVVMGTAQPEYHLVTSQGAGDGQVTRRVLFTSGDVITCVAEIQGPGHMTEPAQLLETGQIQRYVSDVDPVLQGTESMLRASQEILRSAENQSSNV